MECTWSLSRYSRCYTDYNKQATGVDGKKSLFPFFAQNKNGSAGAQSQLVNTGVWSTILKHAKTSLQISLTVISERSCSIEIKLIPKFDNWELQAASNMNSIHQFEEQTAPIVLESFSFPETFTADLKISPKTECIAFRYQIKNERFCFQVDFETAFECFMCYQMLFRLGVITPQWRDIYKYLIVPKIFSSTCSIDLMNGLNFEMSKVALTPVPSPTVHPDIRNFPKRVQEPEAIQEPEQSEATMTDPDSQKTVLSDTDDIALMFMPSQPLPSQKFISPTQHQILTQELENASVPIFLEADASDLFTPMSFQEFGYDSKSKF